MVAKLTILTICKKIGDGPDSFAKIRGSLVRPYPKNPRWPSQTYCEKSSMVQSDLLRKILDGPVRPTHTRCLSNPKRAARVGAVLSITRCGHTHTLEKALPQGTSKKERSRVRTGSSAVHVKCRHALGDECFPVSLFCGPGILCPRHSHQRRRYYVLAPRCTENKKS